MTTEPQHTDPEANGALRADSLPEPVSHPPGPPEPTTTPEAEQGRAAPVPELRDRGGRRIYSDDEIAHTLAMLEANGGNILATSEAIGVPEQTIREWRDGRRRAVGASPQLRERIRAQLAERARGVADRMLTRMETADLETVGVKDAAIVFGIVTEKSLLLDGEATSITEHRKPEDEQREQSARELARQRYTSRRKLVVKPAPPVVLEPEGGAGAAKGSGEGERTE